MNISTRFMLVCALAGSITLPGAEVSSGAAAESPTVRAAAPKFSTAAEARVRAIENFMSATKSQDRDERFALLLEVLKDDPTSIPPRNYLRAMADTRADARKIAAKLLELSRQHPREIGLAALAFQMSYFANLPPGEYLSDISDLLAKVDDPAKLSDEEQNEYLQVVEIYASALKQARNYREGTNFFDSELDRISSSGRLPLLRCAVEFEHFFSKFGNRERRWFGLVGSDREKAAEKFEELFAELEEQELDDEEAERAIKFYLSVDQPEAALKLAEKLMKANSAPPHAARFAYAAIAAKKFDLVPPVVEKLAKLDKWQGISLLISIESLLAQQKFDEAKQIIQQLKTPIARAELMLKLHTAKKDFQAMRDELDAMAKRHSPGTEADLTNALHQLVVAEKLRDTELLNRIWKHLADTRQLDSDAANAVGYVAAELNVRLDEAKALIEQALAEESDNYAFLDSMAWVLFRQGKYAEALDFIDQALRASEQETARGVILEHKGDILVKLDRKSEALAVYREALDYAEDEDFDPNRVEEKIRQLE